ncbi:MAG: PhzF family phenazine biosynthesis protein [Candidatus Puniceispirillales bacterium]
MDLEFYTVDVFSNKIFGGNPLAIFTNTDDISTDLMQSIASEVNYSETVFIQKPKNKDNTAKVKIFTPKNELPFAGHPNVGAGFLLSCFPNLIPGNYSKNKMVFEEIAGLVNVIPQYNGATVVGSKIEAPNKFHKLETVPTTAIQNCIETNEGSIITSNDPPVVAGVGLDFVIAEVQNEEILNNARCNISAFSEADKNFSYGEDFFSLMIYYRGNQQNIFARVFAPLSGIVEDAATGSACGALGALLASQSNDRNNKYNYKIHQGEMIGRPSLINVSILKEKGQIKRTYISGECVLVSKGNFFI